MADMQRVTVTLDDSLVRAFVEWCMATSEHHGTDWEPLVELLNAAPVATWLLSKAWDTWPEETPHCGASVGGRCLIHDCPHHASAAAEPAP